MWWQILRRINNYRNKKLGATKMINNGGGRGIDQHERVWGQLFKTELPTVSTGTISLTSTDFPVESTRGTNTVASILRSSFLLRWSCIFLFLVPISSSMSIFLGFESSPTGASTTAKSEGSSAKPEMNWCFQTESRLIFLVNLF